MAKRKKSTLQRYLAELKRNYDIVLTEQNYKDMILAELGFVPSLLDYFKDYIARNEDVITLKWGCLIFLLVKADEEGNVSEIERYYKLLRKYPVNWLMEVTIAELELRYYGNVFRAKNRLRAALELKQNDAHCHYNLGFVYYLLGVFDKSAEHYEKAVIHCRNTNKPSELKARSLFNLAVREINIEHDYKKAKKLLNDALREMPDYPQAKHALRQIR